MRWREQSPGSPAFGRLRLLVVDHGHSRRRDIVKRVDALTGDAQGETELYEFALRYHGRECSAGVSKKGGRLFYLLPDSAGGESLRTLVKDQKRIALITGAEGGFSPEEAAALTAAGAVPVGLGPRILRCETAPVAGLAAVMTLAGQLE